MFRHSINKMNSAGYLELILGPMFSGKTSYLLDIYKKSKLCNIQIAVINHSSDNRYDDELMTTHDKMKIPCIKTSRLMDLWSDFIDLEENVDNIPRVNDKFKIIISNVILINEGQFFPDLEEFVKLLLKEGKSIFVCGLDGDFERKKFGQILDLIPICDKVTKLNSLCGICKNGTPGIFSKRITNEKEQFLIGSDNYIPVCRSCYEDKK